MILREKVQSIAKEKGHCVCSSLFKCPCKYFLDKDICKCAGEGDLAFDEWLKYNGREKDN